jgi:hypothetical protein
MIIGRTSLLSGLYHEMEVDITQEQVIRIEGGEHVQRVVPHLSADIREFLINGITPEEWTKTFGDGDE